MRPIHFTTTLAALLFSADILADSIASHEKVKTGILPSGAFFSIYEVSCVNDRRAHIATLDRRRTWCMIDGIDLDCFRAPKQAADRACAARQLDLASDDKSTAADV